MASLRKYLTFFLMLSLMTSCATLDVMSFNVRQSHARESEPQNAWDKRKEACLEMLNATKPDIVALQEAYWKGQWSFFAENLKREYDGVAVGRDDGDKKGECTGILFKAQKFEKLSGGTFWLAEDTTKPAVCFKDKYNCPRTVTWILLKDKKSKRRFYVLNTHLSLDPYSQSRSFNIIFDWLKTNNKENLPIVLTGDFNMQPDSHTLDPLRAIMCDAREVTMQDQTGNATAQGQAGTASQVVRTDKVKSYNAWGNAKKACIIDYIWLNKGFECTAFRTDTNAYGGHKFISDHYPIIATIKFK